MQQFTLLCTGKNSAIYSYGLEEDRVVLKVVCNAYLKEQDHLKNQFKILQNLHHRYVVKILRYKQNIASRANNLQKYNVMVTDYASKGSLFGYLQRQRPTISVKRRAFKNIVQGLIYLHSHGIAHRDLKLQNILVFVQNETQIFKINDFGFASRFLKNGNILRFKEFKGTKGYMAPQIHQCAENRQNKYDAAKTDIFALGVILFSLVFRQYPFGQAISSDPYFKCIKQKQFSTFWNWHNVQEFQLQTDYRLQELKNLFEKMVSFDPEQRPSIQQVQMHQWLSEGVALQNT